MTRVWPALWPPWKRTTTSASTESQSTILPLPSSPHWAPTTTTFATSSRSSRKKARRKAGPKPCASSSGKAAARSRRARTLRSELEGRLSRSGPGMRRAGEGAVAGPEAAGVAQAAHHGGGEDRAVLVEAMGGLAALAAPGAPAGAAAAERRHHEEVGELAHEIARLGDAVEGALLRGHEGFGQVAGVH